jgi:hypothetical protein
MSLNDPSSAGFLATAAGPRLEALDKKIENIMKHLGIFGDDCCAQDSEFSSSFSYSRISKLFVTWALKTTLASRRTSKH